MAMLKRGLFILFEGLDRTGKSTQAKLLAQKLNEEGHNAELINFPNRTTATGKIIDDYLKKKIELNDQSVHLLFVANRWECMDVMEQALKAGKTLVCDRYSYSGAVFSSAKGVSGIDIPWCMAPEKGMLKPDMVFLFDAPVDELSKRGSYGEERYEREDMQRHVQQLFRTFLDDPIWQLIPVISSSGVSRSVEDLHADLFGQVSAALAARSGDEALGRIE